MHGFVTIDDPSIGEPFYLYIYMFYLGYCLVFNIQPSAMVEIVDIIW